MNPTPTHPPHRCIIVFGRYPQPGKVKTRLIPALGSLGAADLQRRLTEKTIDTILKVKQTKTQFCYDGASQSQVRRWLGRPSVSIGPQREGDLGQRMAAALDEALSCGYQQVVLVGTDLPQMTADHIDSAFQTLDDHCDVVLGPSMDGGYWLVGVKRPAALFDDIPWGSDQVLKATLVAAAKQGLSAALLEPLNDIDTPADLEAWRPDGNWQSPFLSVIIPVLNEAEHVQATIRQVRSAHTQVIVVDGGSRDNTVDLSLECGASVLASPPGRAVQQNLAAGEALGRVLLFLHADTRLPDDFKALLFETLMDRSVVLGAFRFKTDQTGLGMRLIEWAANVRSTRFNLPYGDQAFFLRRKLFNGVGGFPEAPIAEDLFLARRLSRLGRVELAKGYAITSARRWRALGMARTTLINYLIAGGCLLGIPPARLAPLYRLGMKRRKI
jgi:rSAM/selenodomain-associated transferase 2/rSAM/selenodomain-associated transferase 1